MYRRFLVCAALLALTNYAVLADEPPKADEPAAAKADDQKNADESKEKLYDKFEEMMSGVRMIGRFTVTGNDDDNPPQKEEYVISSVTKMPNGDYWLFKTRIKYGNHDVTVPLPIEVKWADQTPVITVDHLTIPGMGTFDARVVIDNDKYAGTWAHGEVGGHLFGEIKKLTADELQKADKKEENKEDKKEDKK